MSLREHKGVAIAAAVAGVAVVLYAAGVRPDLPDVEKLIEDLAHTLGKWTYLLVGGLAFLETGAFVGLVAPGETAVIAGGVIAGQGEIDLLLLIGIVWAAAVLGDSTSFMLGRRLGRRFVLEHGGRIRISRERFEQVESYFDRHGGKTILIGRFIGLVRALAPFIAGSSGLPYARFLPYSVIGCGIWATVFAVLGYVFSRSFDQVTAVAGKATLGFGITIAFIAVVVIAYRTLRDERRRTRMIEAMESRPVLRQLLAVMRRFEPQLRFAARRLTPGGLGIEFTTTIAVAGIGAYVFTLYATLVSGGGPQPTPADNELLDLADSAHSAAGADVAGVVTDLGSFPTVATLVVAACALLASRRRFAELGALAAGFAALYVAVQLAKSGIDRPRPDGPLERTEGAAYPSGHAAYSAVWVMGAVLLARAAPGIARRAALVGGAVALAAAIGLTRVYLRVHWWSDVAGGWALAAAVLGGAGVIALAVSHLRHNGSQDEPRPVDD